jgi:hypothetical protein
MRIKVLGLLLALVPAVAWAYRTPENPAVTAPGVQYQYYNVDRKSVV